MSKSSKNNSGFSLVEALIAISILSLSILASFGAVQNSLQYSGLTKDQITAFYLIQEGMEYFRNIRDENALNDLGGNTRNWLYGLSSGAGDPCSTGSTCQLDLNNSPTLAKCAGGFGTCSNLYVSPANGAYGYNGSWTPTTYKREIQFEPVPLNTDEVRITIRISWTSRGQAKSVQVSELLYNRQ